LLSAHEWADDLRLDLRVELRAGPAIVLTLSVHNRGQHAVELFLDGRPPHDFIVTRVDGTQVWRAFDGQAREDVLEVRTLPPGQDLRWHAEWNRRDNHGEPIPPGTYLVDATLRTEAGELRAPTTSVSITHPAK
jgi:hypothetical protein